MRPARRAACVNRSGVLVLAGYSIVLAHANCHLINKRPEALCHYRRPPDARAGQFLAPGLGQHIVNPRVRNIAQVVRLGHHAMGRVSIWAQWTIIAAGVVLCPVFVLLVTCLIGWSLFRRSWPRPEVAPGRRLGGPLQLREGNAAHCYLIPRLPRIAFSLVRWPRPEQNH
jgi:hypothetical protein